MSVASAMRSRSLRLRWVARGGWRWLTLRPGTRPRRAARRLAVASIQLVLARPRLAQAARFALRPMPVLRGHLRNLGRRPVRPGELSRRGREIRAMLVDATRRRGRNAD